MPPKELLGGVRGANLIAGNDVFGGTDDAVGPTSDVLDRAVVRLLEVKGYVLVHVRQEGGHVTRRLVPLHLGLHHCSPRLVPLHDIYQRVRTGRYSIPPLNSYARTRISISTI